MNNLPEWLRVGAVVEFAFCVGQVIDIAVSPERVMVLVKSPKGIWRNHPAEWIEYHDGAIKPATAERARRDVALYREYILKMVEAVDTLEQEWTLSLPESVQEPELARA